MALSHVGRPYGTMCAEATWSATVATRVVLRKGRKGTANHRSYSNCAYKKMTHSDPSTTHALMTCEKTSLGRHESSLLRRRVACTLHAFGNVGHVRKDKLVQQCGDARRTKQLAHKAAQRMIKNPMRFHTVRALGLRSTQLPLALPNTSHAPTTCGKAHLGLHCIQVAVGALH